MALSPDGKLPATVGATGAIRLWDVRTGRAVGSPLAGHVGRVNAVAFSPEGTLLASTGKDHTVLLWDIPTRQPFAAPLTGTSAASKPWRAVRMARF
ncbi:MAG: WD40 repeat domain-containing protein [Pseudonocardiaceae bacterium]